MTISDTFNLDDLSSELRTDEGVRLFPYIDTTGKVTIGVGRNLTSVGISADEANALFLNDIERAVASLDVDTPWWRQLPQPQQRVMINLAFNMGINHLLGFVHFLAAMQAHNWTSAAIELRNSLWFTQVGNRGPRMLARLGTPPEPQPTSEIA